MAVIHRLTERTLDDTFAQTPYLLACLDRSAMVSFARGLPEYLEHRFPRLLTFATVSRTDLAPMRIIEIFQSTVGALRGGVKDGYYLFEGHYVVGYHLGQFRATSVSFAETREETDMRDRIIASPAGVIRLSPGEMEAVRQLAIYFEPIIVRKQRAAGYGDDGGSFYTSGYVYESRSSSSSQTPPGGSSGSSSRQSTPGGSSGGSSSTGSGAGPRVSAPAADDPYTLLGIAASASDDEVKSAYRNQLKLNHPDKVAHLSPALQAFAQAQTIAVKNAYESILAMRGKKR